MKIITLFLFVLCISFNAMGVGSTVTFVQNYSSLTQELVIIGSQACSLAKQLEAAGVSLHSAPRDSCVRFGRIDERQIQPSAIVVPYKNNMKGPFILFQVKGKPTYYFSSTTTSGKYTFPTNITYELTGQDREMADAMGEPTSKTDYKGNASVDVNSRTAQFNKIQGYDTATVIAYIAGEATKPLSGWTAKKTECKFLLAGIKSIEKLLGKLKSKSSTKRHARQLSGQLKRLKKDVNKSSELKYKHGRKKVFCK